MTAAATTSEEIIANLDVLGVYRSLGLEITREPDARGWAPCRAMGREDRNPSAAINVKSGRYKDHGGDGDNLSLWDFAAKYGPYATWQEAKDHFAATAGVPTNGRPSPKGSGQASTAGTNGNGRRKRPKKGAVYSLPKTAVKALDMHMAKKHSGKRVALWKYHDVEGELVSVVIRYDLPTPAGEKQLKTFRPISKHADGWRWCDPEGKWPLYRVGDVLGSNGRVYVQEGEGCVDAAKSIGLIATTSAHGAEAAAKTEWKWLAGRECILMADSDSAGEGYVEDVEGILLRLDPPAIVKRILLPELSPGDDIKNWITARSDFDPSELRSEIEAMADAAESIELKPEPEPQPGPDTDPQPRVKSYQTLTPGTLVRAADRDNIGQVRWIAWLGVSYIAITV